MIILFVVCTSRIAVIGGGSSSNSVVCCYIPYFFSIHSNFYLVARIGLENSTYNTSENAGSVVVCAQVTGPQLGSKFTVDVTTQDGTAQSISKPAYINFLFNQIK